MIRDYAKTNGNTKNQHELSPDDKMLQTQQLQNIIQSYNMSFLTDKNTFNTSNMILTDKNINKCRSKNRKMPISLLCLAWAWACEPLRLAPHVVQSVCNP